jgi:LysM repeat protein
MRRRSPARWLAPLALIACAFAIYTVVDQELLKDDGGAKTSTSRTSTSGGTASTSTTKRKSGRKARSYTVKSGDTFSGIADKEGVEVEALQEANPKVDASALHPGQKLKLPR